MVIEQYNATLKEHKKQIESVVGNFSFLNRLRNRSMVLDQVVLQDASPKLHLDIFSDDGLVYASLRLRPKGLLVFLHSGNSQLVWAVPYHHLSVFYAGTLNIHGQGNYIKLRVEGKGQMPFVSQLMRLKSMHTGTRIDD